MPRVPTFTFDFKFSASRNHITLSNVHFKFYLIAFQGPRIKNYLFISSVCHLLLCCNKSVFKLFENSSCFKLLIMFQMKMLPKSKYFIVGRAVIHVQKLQSCCSSCRFDSWTFAPSVTQKRKKLLWLQEKSLYFIQDSA